MYYNFFNATIATQQHILDTLAANGMFLMAYVVLEMEFGVVQNGLNTPQAMHSSAMCMYISTCMPAYINIC